MRPELIVPVRPGVPTPLDRMTRAYAEAALWSSADEYGEPLCPDLGYTDIDPETYSKMRADCAAFLAANNADIDATNFRGQLGEHDIYGQAGCDFWLTRNGHGCGFWDGDWPGEAGERLDDYSALAGEVCLYVGDDGKIYA